MAEQVTDTVGGSQPQLPDDVLEALLQEPTNARHMWMLSNEALPWFAQQGRIFQVTLAAHCPLLFRHLVSEGVAPELFYLWWLQGFFQGALDNDTAVRIWDQFVMERSHKVFVRTAVAIFSLLENRLRRGDVEQMMKILFDIESVGLGPDDVVQVALATKVTRRLMREA